MVKHSKFYLIESHKNVNGVVGKSKFYDVSNKGITIWVEDMLTCKRFETQKEAEEQLNKLKSPLNSLSVIELQVKNVYTKENVQEKQEALNDREKRLGEVLNYYRTKRDLAYSVFDKIRYTRSPTTKSFNSYTGDYGNFKVYKLLCYNIKVFLENRNLSFKIDIDKEFDSDIRKECWNLKLDKIKDVNFTYYNGVDCSLLRYPNVEKSEVIDNFILKDLCGIDMDKISPTKVKKYDTNQIRYFDNLIMDNLSKIPELQSKYDKWLDSLFEQVKPDLEKVIKVLKAA